MALPAKRLNDNNRILTFKSSANYRKSSQSVTIVKDIPSVTRGFHPAFNH